MNGEKEKRPDEAGMDAARQRVLELQQRSRFAADQLNRKAGSMREESAAPEVKKPLSVTNAGEEDKDRMFILSLCLLLAGEGADEGLIVALMYLLS